MIPDPSGQVIKSLRLTNSLWIVTTGGYQIDLEGDITIWRADAEPIDIEFDYREAMEDIQAEIEALPPVLRAFVGETLTGLLMGSGGDLTIQIGDTQIRVDGMSAIEPWHLFGPRGEMVVCQSGGKLTTWGPRGQ